MRKSYARSVCVFSHWVSVSLCPCAPVCLSLFRSVSFVQFVSVLKMDFDQSFESVAAVPDAFLVDCESCDDMETSCKSLRLPDKIWVGEISLLAGT